MEKMTIKEFMKLYAYNTELMYDSQYINPNGRSLRVECFSSWDNSIDNIPIHPVTGDPCENHFYGIIFYDDHIFVNCNDLISKADYPQVIAFIAEQCYSEYDYFDDWCNQELEV